MLRLFPFSFKDKAKHWLNFLPTNSITTWDQLQLRFLEKYFPIGKTNQLRRAITNFAQMDGEQFHEMWERLRDILQQCLYHQVPDWQLVQTFYCGLTEPHRQMVDSSCGGTFMSKNDAKAWQLFENLSDNSLHHASVARQVRQPVVGALIRGVFMRSGKTQSQPNKQRHCPTKWTNYYLWDMSLPSKIILNFKRHVLYVRALLMT